ncbi:MAG: hypothetical protein RR992_03000, partial [Clostridiales bacterium]
MIAKFPSFYFIFKLFIYFLGLFTILFYFKTFLPHSNRHYIKKYKLTNNFGTEVALIVSISAKGVVKNTAK